MSTKALRGFEIKAEDQGTVRAVFATLGVKDSDGDVTKPGAFEDGAEVVISAYGHTSWQGALPVGKGTIRTTKSEAVLDGRFFMDTAAGRDTFTVVKELGGRGEWSYGFDVLKNSFGEFDGKQVRFLESLKVFEVSPVLVGAGVGTRTLSAKAAGLRFAEHGEVVLADLRAFVDRAADVKAMRSEKDKTLGADALELVAQIETELKRLRDIPSTEGAPVVDEAVQQLHREYLRFTQRTAGL